MTKSELINTIAEAGLTRKDAGIALDAALNAIGDKLAAGEDVSIVGFGSFTVKDRPEREGRNPSPGEKITIAASRSVGFKAGKALKDKVQG